jgi:hypothetical protein
MERAPRKFKFQIKEFENSGHEILDSAAILLVLERLTLR